MARFKDKDLRLGTNEEVLLGDSQEASLSYDGTDLVSSLPIYASTAPTKDQHLTNKVFVDGEITDVRDYIDDVIKGLEWQDSVLSITQNVPEPGGEGDRYIAVVPSGIAWDPDNTHAFIDLSNENLTTTCNNTGGWISSIANTFKTSGKWYWEITIDVWPVTSIMIGIANSDMVTTHFPGQIDTGVGYYDNNGVAYYAGVPTAYGDAYTLNDVIGVALDLDNGKVFFSKNDVWQNSGDPVAGTGEAQAITPAESWTPAIGFTTDTSSSTMNVGGTAFVGTLPSGYTAIADTGVTWFSDDVIEWETSSYTATTPSAGFATWVIDEGAYYIFSGSSWSRMGSVIDHGLLDGLADDDHTQYVLADGSRGITGTLQVTTVSAGTFEGPGFDHGAMTGLTDDDHPQYLPLDGTRDMESLTVSGEGVGTCVIGPGFGSGDYTGIGLGGVIDSTDFNFLSSPGGDLFINTVTGKKVYVTINNVSEYSFSPTVFDMLAAGIDNVSSISADSALKYYSGGVTEATAHQFYSGNSSIWVERLRITGNTAIAEIQILNSTITGDLLPTSSDTYDIGHSDAVWDNIWCQTLHTSAGSVEIGTTTLTDVGGDLTSDSAIIAPSGSDSNALVTNQRLDDVKQQYGLEHDHDSNYYTQALLDGGQLDGLYYTQALLSGGQLDDRYYTESESDTNFAPASHNNTNHSETYITVAGVTYGSLDGNSDIGTGSDQVSQGDHSHAQLHDESHGNEDHTGTYIEAAGVTYENLDAAGDVGTSAGQVAIGDHTHGGIGGVVAGIAVRGKFIYKDADEVYINAAAYHHAGTAEQLVYWNAQLTKAVTASTGWNYLYLDDSAIVTAGTNILTATELIFSTSVPTWSNTKHGWYSGNDRAIFATYCTGANVQREFFSTGGDYVHFADDWVILAITDIDTTWIDVTCYPPFPGGTVQLTVTNELTTVTNIVHRFLIRVDGQSGSGGTLAIMHQSHTSFVPSLGDNTLIMPTSVAANKVEIKSDFSGLSQVAMKQTGWFFPEGM